jgi:hypothetical protein
MSSKEEKRPSPRYELADRRDHPGKRRTTDRFAVLATWIKSAGPMGRATPAGTFDAMRERIAKKTSSKLESVLAPMSTNPTQHEESVSEVRGRWHPILILPNRALRSFSSSRTMTGSPVQHGSDRPPEQELVLRNLPCHGMAHVFPASPQIYQLPTTTSCPLLRRLGREPSFQLAVQLAVCRGTRTGGPEVGVRTGTPPSSQ